MVHSIMPDNTTPIAPRLARADQVFPTLTPEQVSRIAAHGRVRATQAGETLVEAGDKVVPFFAFTAGQIEIVNRSPERDRTVAVHIPGQFTSELNMISCRPRLFPIALRAG